jgi:enoyl-CoA hydratase/carnithine racemase
VVCAVRGTCFTIGIELMLGCDLCVAAAGTRFAQMEVRRGIMPFGGATLRLPALAGWHRAMRWLLTGDDFDATEALAMGLVSEVVPDGQELARALALAERVASRAPLAVQATLASARQASGASRETAAAELLTEARRLFATEDAREGLASFLERREARFVGR